MRTDEEVKDLCRRAFEAGQTYTAYDEGLRFVVFPPGPPPDFEKWWEDNGEEAS